MTTTARRTGPTAASLATGPFRLHEMYTMYAGVTVPDPITFVIGADWLNRPNLYPRQATLLKVIFLRTDLMSEYDYAIIGMWEEQYRQTGYNGIVPNILWRIKWLKASGAKWFREVLMVMGRRAGKGYIAALAMAYILWVYLSKGDPQKFYGIDRAKRLTAIVFAGKRDQAKATVFADLVGIITGSECFLPYISVTQTERLSIYAPHDFVKMQRLAARGIKTERDQATFEILPKESTTMAGRGSTTFGLVFDEFAHLVAAGTSRGSEDLYKSSKPSTDQFRQDAFIVQPSSPWQMSGQFFANYNEAISLDDDGNPTRPNYLVIQLASWDIYLDYQQAPKIPLFPTGFVGDLGEYVDTALPRLPMIAQAMIVFDDEMRREKQSNPETFAVEREARFATSLDAYLDERLVMKVFQPWLKRPERYGSPMINEQVRGILTFDYKGHADPSKVNDKFGFALAHVEIDDEGRHHCLEGSTRYLTESGVKTLAETVGTTQRVLTSSHEGGFAGQWVDAEIRSFGQQRLYRVTLRRNKRTKIMYATGGHRWIGRTSSTNPRMVVTTEEMIGRRSAFSLTSTFVSPRKPVAHHREAVRHGIVFGDGTRTHKRTTLTLWGDKQSLLPWFDVEHSRQPGKRTPRGVEGTRVGTLPGHFKSFPAAEAGPDYIKAWLAGYFAADGCVTSQGKVILSCIDRSVLEQVRDLAQVAGVSSYGITQAIPGNSAYVPDSILYKIEFLAPSLDPEFFLLDKHRKRFEERRNSRLQASWIVSSVEETDRLEEVFCAVVPATESFVLEDNVLTGNCVFDRIGAFDPADFPEHTIDYEQVEDWLWDHIIKPFCPGEFTFDQYSSIASIQKLQKRVRAAKLPKRVEIFEKTSTRPYDWRVKEATKAAINLGLVHAPPNEDAELELRFLQLVNGRVDHPTTGPVTTKDTADAICETVAVLIGEQTQNFLHPDLSTGASFGGMPSPFAQEMGGLNTMSREDEAVIGAMGAARAKGARTPQDSRNSGRRYRP